MPPLPRTVLPSVLKIVHDMVGPGKATDELVAEIAESWRIDEGDLGDESGDEDEQDEG